MQNNFNGGIISPEMYGRADQAKYQTGVADANNMLVLPHGALDYRNGFEFVRKLTGPFRLIPFIYSDEQAIVIILNPPYAYFATQGQMLLDGSGSLLKVDIPYNAAHLGGIRYAQSGDVVTLTHKTYKPRLLKRLSATSWSIGMFSTGSQVDNPSTATATPTYTNTEGANPSLSQYRVTAWKGTDESSGRNTNTVTNDLSLRPNSNKIEWTAVTGAEKYSVYKKQAGVWGKIGETTDTELVDNFIEPDTTITPPYHRDVFATSNPVAVSYIQQRKAYGGGSSTPQVLNLSRSGTEDIFTYSLPSQDDDAIQFRIAGRDGNGIQHLVPMNDLLVLTSASAWKISATGAITPQEIMVYPQSNTGANDCTPLLTDNVCIFSSDQTGRIHELSMSANRSGAYQTIELSLMCPHLFDGFNIVDQAITRNPFTCAFFVRNDGQMIGLTYDPMQQVFGFHRHTTNGKIKTVAVIPEDTQSSIYLGVERNGEMFLERFRMRRTFDNATENHLDCSVVQKFETAQTTITGLSHLNGKYVSVVADGTIELENHLVAGGSVTVQNPSKVFIVGLPYEGSFDTLPLYGAYQGFNPLKPKVITDVHFRVYKSASVFTAQYYLSESLTFLEKPFVAKAIESKARLDEPYNTAPDLYTGLVQVPMFGTPQKDLQVRVSQKNPMPLTVQAIHLEFK